MRCIFAWVLIAIVLDITTILKIPTSLFILGRKRRFVLFCKLKTDPLSQH